MSAFRFPPPPPPPPKQTSDINDANGYQSNGYGFSSRGSRGGPHSQGRGGRGGFDSQRGGHGMHRGRGGQTGFGGRGGMSTSGPMSGEKRKWSDRGGRGGPYQRPQQQQQPNPPHSRNPHMDVAPAVPNFGFSFPATAPTQVSPSLQAPAKSESKQKAKRKHNILGLTPKGADREDSEDEVDEEAAFAAQLLVQSGGLPNTQNRVEMAAWLAERRKRYPTKARLEEKQKAQKEAELERLKQKAKASLDANKSRTKHTGKDGNMSKEEKQQAKLEKHLRKAERLRQQLAGNAVAAEHTEPSAMPPAAQSSLLGAGYESDEETDGVNGANVNASASSDTSSASDSDSDSSSTPSETTSRQPPPTQTPQPQRKAREQEPIPPHLIPWVKRGFCANFMQQKPCRFGPKCRNKHKIPHEVQNMKLPRKRLFDRLVEQEVQNEHMAAVNAVKALGATGFFNGL